MAFPSSTFTTTVGTRLEVSAPEMSGQGFQVGDTMVLVEPPSRGQLRISPDGSFSYTPDAGFVGTDRFSVATLRGSTRSQASLVTIRVIPRTPAPSVAVVELVEPPAADSFSVGPSTDGASSPTISFGTLGPLDFAFVWLIPGLVVTLPGLLVVLAVVAQGIAGTVWLPLIRRELGDFGIRRKPNAGPARA